MTALFSWVGVCKEKCDCSKGNSKVLIFRIGWDFNYSCLSYITTEIFPNVLYAIIDVPGWALGEHLDGAVRQVADETGELVALGHPVCGKAKTNALDTTDKNHKSCNHYLWPIYYWLSTYSLQYWYINRYIPLLQANKSGCW